MAVEEMASETKIVPPGAVASEQAIAVQAGSPPAEVPRTGEILPPKRKRRRIVLPLIVMAAVGGGGYEGYKWFTEGRFIVSTDDAYIKADTSAIAAKVPGYVTSVPVVDGAAVHKGQVLATIDDGDYRNAVDAARARMATQTATVERIGKQVGAQQASIEQARAMLLSAKADATRAEAEFVRADSLMRSSYGTQQKLDEARADRDRSTAAVANAAAAVTAAVAALDVLKAQKIEAEKVMGELQTTLDKADRDLSFTVVKAPFEGIVGNKSVEQGSYVQPGTRLLALVPLDTAYVAANFKETQIGRLKPGQKVVIKPDAYGNRDVVGSVESIAPASGAEFSLLPPENATGNFTKIVQRIPVRIVVPPAIAREGILRPGLSVVVDVHTRPDDEPKPSLVSALGLDGLAGRLEGLVHQAIRKVRGEVDAATPLQATTVADGRQTSTH